MKKILLLAFLIVPTVMFGQSNIQVFRAGSVDSYTKTQLQTSGSSSINWDNLTGGLSDLKVVTGILRYSRADSVWVVLSSDTHTSINVDSIAQNISLGKIRIYFHGMDSILSFVVGKDEAMALHNIDAGASVSYTYADLYYYRSGVSVGGYVYYTGSAWSRTGHRGHVSIASYTDGLLTVNHDYIRDIAVSIAPRDGKYIVQMGSPGYTNTTFKFYDYDGTLITTPNADMKFSFVRQELGPSVMTYTDLNESWLDGANFWFIGIFK